MTTVDIRLVAASHKGHKLRKTVNHIDNRREDKNSTMEQLKAGPRLSAV